MDGDPRAYLFALAPAGVVVAVGPALAFTLPSTVTLGPLRALGVPVVAGGLGLAVWAVRAFARAGEPPSPADPPGRLVTAGPMAHTRNPIYLGTVVAAAGMAVVLSSAVVAGYAAALWLVYHLLVVYREEPELSRAFGEEFDRYRGDVPRWLWY